MCGTSVRTQSSRTTHDLNVYRIQRHLPLSINKLAAWKRDHRGAPGCGASSHDGARHSDFDIDRLGRDEAEAAARAKDARLDVDVHPRGVRVVVKLRGEGADDHPTPLAVHAGADPARPPVGPKEDLQLPRVLDHLGHHRSHIGRHVRLVRPLCLFGGLEQHHLRRDIPHTVPIPLHPSQRVGPVAARVHVLHSQQVHLLHVLHMVEARLCHPGADQLERRRRILFQQRLLCSFAVHLVRVGDRVRPRTVHLQEELRREGTVCIRHTKVALVPVRLLQGWLRAALR
mmetsp:Transcript_41989/g.139228  ORF Transcript_41989/g.139228 Transcript_41989/m.139228 type:complete len:286 (+) Transcript_41989:50-907(+)